MAAADNRILKKLLDRLFASLINGPSLNCRPHSSRQRIDLVQFAKLKDKSPEDLLRALLSANREVKISAQVPAPRGRRSIAADEEPDDEDLSPEERAARQAFRDQQAVFGKLRAIAEDSRTYENDTGVHVLQIGFPLLSLPPGSAGRFGLTRRILAPLAFISLSMTVKGGPTPSIALECRNDGADLVVPNVALLAWLEGQTGQPIGELLDDETGEKPWAEIVAIAKRVCELVQVQLPTVFAGDEIPPDFVLRPSPKSDEDEEPRPAVINAAVAGLFPMANQGLLRDMQALAGGEAATGPIESFIKVGISLDAAPATPESESTLEKRTRSFADERLVTVADPCQARAVRLARTSRGLVVHGPPGTGKSQTIANIIGDHLARGERVLFVCDKRTALDVVMNRLDGMGLGSLCGIVHDPQRDQRELYKSIREQLEGLADLKSDASADGKLAKADVELQRLHGELTEYHAALMKRPDKDSLSFHELMGKWLTLPDSNVQFDGNLLASSSIQEVEANAQTLADLFDRAAKVGYVANPWTAAAGLKLDDFLTTHGNQYRAELARFAASCQAADVTIDPAIPPLPGGRDPAAVAEARGKLADDLERVRGAVPMARRARWATSDSTGFKRAIQRLHDADAYAATVAMGPLDREFVAVTGDALPTIAQIAEQTAELEQYLSSSKSLLGFLAFGPKSAAGRTLKKYGLQRTPDAAVRILAFLSGLKSRLLLRATLGELEAEPFAQALPDDEALLAPLRELQTLLPFLAALGTDSDIVDLAKPIREAVASDAVPADLLKGLRATPARVASIRGVEENLRIPLFAAAAREKIIAAARAGERLSATATALVERSGSVENVLRVREVLATLPTSLQAAAAQLVNQNVSGEVGMTVAQKAADANEIVRRLKANRLLMTADGQALESSFNRYQQLDASKRELTRAAVLHRWISRQKERLLAGTGNRLNALGADLRRRLTIRGERAMRLRQVVQVGNAIEGGDPLYDLRPIWMASPETVAQLFARQPLFDVVIFDEASQCRLEEALPVLLRAKRVVIAGDPKQLPPTRFFESAVAASEDAEIESEQQLFESQQGEIEDLLAAALNIEIEECYLDVHYRSRNSDLIEFSNENFYSSRLQAIPGHPHNRTQFAPLTLYKANGTYEKRTNVAEAEKVCQIVKDLLKRAHSPSIGIACFNIAQRDLILEKLEEMAGSDAEFGRALAAARERRSTTSFEGLFVKNLENVQGDERDHMVISTTYGPDAKGRFYRRFGPVGSAGGGRRLNVLVTRARDEVHLVTSIPETVYRNLPPIPPGETPGGAWLLFAYLVYAEKLAEEYAQNHRLLAQVQSTHEAVVTERPSRFPSEFATRLAKRLQAQQKLGSDVHWGNDGFCIDIAVHHPTRAEDVTVGILCDMNRFEQAADQVEWEVFRTAILSSQGWALSRVWTPHYFRDREAVTRGLVKDIEATLAAESNRDALRVAPS